MLYSSVMSRFFKIAGPLLALIAIAAAGCSKPEDAYIGHFTGKLTLSQKALDQLSKMGTMGNSLKDQMTKATIDLELKKDKSFTMATDTHMGQTTTASGTWALANNQVVLTPSAETSNGKTNAVPAKQTLKLNPSADKKTLIPDMSSLPGGADSGTSITFTKA
jgi:hypothetical protein